MKKTLLLALGLGTALAASAASPNYLQEVKSNCAEVNRQKVDMTVHTSAPVAMKVNNVKMLPQCRESLRRAKLQRNAHGITKWVFSLRGLTQNIKAM